MNRMTEMHKPKTLNHLYLTCVCGSRMNITQEEYEQFEVIECQVCGTDCDTGLVRNDADKMMHSEFV